jgi:hypothetical protein
VAIGYMNNVEIMLDDLRTVSDFGEELLDLIFEQRDAIG